MRLFQIEEPEGGPSDPDAPGAAIGIDLSGAAAQVAMSIGGNAAILSDRDGFEQDLAVPAFGTALPLWQELFEGARLRAERALARPITHAVIVARSQDSDGAAAALLTDAAQRAGLAVLRLVAISELPAGAAPVLRAAMLAEDLAPRSFGAG